MTLLQEPAERVGLSPLLQRLHGCVGQLEQFPVKVHTLPGIKQVLVTVAIATVIQYLIL